jgi:hypothetical protein
MRRMLHVTVLVAILGGAGAVGAVLLTVHSLSRKYEPTRITLTAPVDVSSVFVPSGWMGDAAEGEGFVRLSEVGREDKFGDEGEHGKILKFTVRAGPRGWAGICWQYPVNNWGERPGAAVEGARRLAFSAAGSQGGEVLEFRVGITRADSAKAALGPTVLQAEWQRFEIELRDPDLTNVVTAFAWIAPRVNSAKQMIFYLKDIRLE